METIQIACVPADWDASTITAVGLRRNGRRALPVTITARELPEPWLTVWHGLVDALRGVAPGEWAATFIECQLAEDENGEPAVRLVIQRRWDDATTAEPVELLMGGEAVAFFEYLTNN
ncbi:MAG: hypothetical protein IKZ07_03775 [Akkermansia sp.]|nr:hypothetical protein [Akkermansia sp.]